MSSKFDEAYEATITREQARSLIDAVENVSDELLTALDEAQGSVEPGRPAYLLITIKS